MTNLDLLRFHEAAFWPKAKLNIESGCWDWTGTKCGWKLAYGSFRRKGLNVRAHRAAWMLKYGEIPAGTFVCHACDNPGCVNPEHLFLGTNAENMRDMHGKGRAPKYRTAFKNGSSNPASKLTPSDVLEIRRRAASGESLASLDRAFGLSHGCVHQIVHRKTWASLPDPKEQDHE